MRVLQLFCFTKDDIMAGAATLNTKPIAQMFSQEAIASSWI